MIVRGEKLAQGFLVSDDRSQRESGLGHDTYGAAYGSSMTCAE